MNIDTILRCLENEVLKIAKKTAKFTFTGFLALVVITFGIYLGDGSSSSDSFFSEIISQITDKQSKTQDYPALRDVKDYDGGEQEITLNHNQPDFSKKDLSLENGSWEKYSDLDSLGRAGAANAMLGKDLFPTEEREALTIDPSGWNQLEIGDNQWLYNRSHLIGFQLSGENNNEKNLMTGTRSLNSPYMLLHENDIAEYIKETNHHVRYRVTPYFKNTELAARGVQLEAQSVEDSKLHFNVFIYNIQEGYTIDYQSGKAVESVGR